MCSYVIWGIQNLHITCLGRAPCIRLQTCYRKIKHGISVLLWSLFRQPCVDCYIPRNPFRNQRNLPLQFSKNNRFRYWIKYQWQITLSCKQSNASLIDLQEECYIQIGKSDLYAELSSRTVFLKSLEIKCSFSSCTHSVRKILVRELVIFHSLYICTHLQNLTLLVFRK